jgi:hypothetical protein
LGADLADIDGGQSPAGGSRVRVASAPGELRRKLGAPMKQ